MELVTISKVSKDYGISTRTLRYYEEIGLISSSDKEDYAYRAYDIQTINRIQQIVVLRKLSLSLKQIKAIFDNDDAQYALKVFLVKVEEIDNEVNSLNAVKSVLKSLIDKLKHSLDFDINSHLSDDSQLVNVINSLSSTSKKLKEKKAMENVKKVSETKESLGDVRIIYLPPAKVVSCHYVGKEPENNASKILDKFVLDNDLANKKPDLRVYGFNNPNPEGDEDYGYEYWVTIPDDMDVDETAIKKEFGGGLYATYCIKMGDFHKWQTFFEWVVKSEEYEYDPREPLSMGGSMEEHLNAFSFFNNKNEDRSFIQLDLLIPIKEISK